MPITGRCYCGALSFRAEAQPQTVAWCHCRDCRRWTGAPVAAFAAFAPEDLRFEPGLGDGFAPRAGVTRWVCGDCGSPMAAAFDYLPGQVYVPLGVIDQAGQLPPRLHAHAAERLGWLHIEDDLPRAVGTSRAALREAGRDDA